MSRNLCVKIVSVYLKPSNLQTASCEIKHRNLEAVVGMVQSDVFQFEKTAEEVGSYIYMVVLADM